MHDNVLGYLCCYHYLSRSMPSFQLRPKEHLCVTEEATRKTYGRHGVNVVFITIAGSAGM